MIYSRIYKVCRDRRVVAMMMGMALLVACMGLSSCFKEKPIAMPNIYNGPDVFVANMGDNYTQQLYFNMQTFQFTDSNRNYEYDMAFDCAPGNYRAWINGARLMFACATGKYSLQEAGFADTVNHLWREELGSGVPAQNAIGDWGGPQSRREVYLLNLGTDTLGNPLGFKKMQMGDCVGDAYTVTYCNMDGSEMHTVTVPRKGNRNKVYLSFAGSVVKDMEPDYNNWDITFTRYSVYFSFERLPYQVTGVLTNPHKSLSYFMDSTSSFDQITIDSVKQNKFTTSLDNIGYEWKRYGLGTTAAYTTEQKYNYIIKSDTRYYKLRFLDFNNAAAVKGYPKFQVDELK